jgi:hypothetical protein
MSKSNYTLIFGITFLLGSIFNSGCEDLIIKDYGYLKGIISIGPICPVETDPPQPGCLPTAETYKAYPVSVWTSDGKIKIARINPSLDGSYTTELPEGNYLVILEKDQKNIGSSNLPVKVSIISYQETVLNIDIDTGIR